jgi:3-isopropylmalate dehydrogenase
MKIAVIPGDGIGKEVIKEGLKVLKLFGIKYKIFNYDADYWLKHKKGITNKEIKKLKKNYDAIYFGALGDERIPDMQHGKDILLKLRFGLDLYANIRPIQNIKSELSPLKNKKDIDIIILRENTEDLYKGIGNRFKTTTNDEIVLDQRIHTKKGVKRIIKYAFEYALLNKRKKLMLVDKHNAIPNGGKLWLETFEKYSKKYPEIITSYEHVDIAAAKMVLEPENMDVIVTSNLFGDILSDLGAGIVGGMGLLGSSNINLKNLGLFEPIHGSAPDIVGKNIANPIAALTTLAMMLAHLKLFEYEKVLNKAIKKSIKNNITTPDLQGTYSTSEVGDYITKLVKKYMKKGE